MKIGKYTFCHVPHIIVVGDVSLPEELLNLWMTVDKNAVKINATFFQYCQTPPQALFFHVVTTTNLIALLPRHKKKTKNKINSISISQMDIL